MVSLSITNQNHSETQCMYCIINKEWKLVKHIIYGVTKNAMAIMNYFLGKYQLFST